METLKVEMPQQYLESEIPGVKQRVTVRNLSADDWVEIHASGTLRKNKKIGLRWKKQYLSERVAYEFGHEFECVASSRVTFNDAVTYGDCKALTEVGWYAERYLSLNPYPDSDIFEIKYIQIEEEDGNRREGVGLVCRQTSVLFLPAGSLLLSLFASWDPAKKEWDPVRNPF